MSIAFGIYDFFSYTPPGFLYIFTLNALLAIMKLPHFTVGNISLDIGFALVSVVVAYIVGGLLDTFAYRWYLLFYRNRIEHQALDQIKKNYPGLKIEFDVKDRRLLFSFIKHNNLELAENIDKFKALNIMFHNISFALLLFSLVQLAKLILEGFSVATLSTLIAAAIFSVVAIRRSALFNLWYWSGNFEQALHYGKNVSEMFARYDQKKNETKTAVKK